MRNVHPAARPELKEALKSGNPRFRGPDPSHPYKAFYGIGSKKVSLYSPERLTAHALLAEKGIDFFTEMMEGVAWHKSLKDGLLLIESDVVSKMAFDLCTLGEPFEHNNPDKLMEGEIRTVHVKGTVSLYIKIQNVPVIYTVNIRNVLKLMLAAADNLYPEAYDTIPKLVRLFTSKKVRPKEIADEAVKTGLTVQYEDCSTQYNSIMNIGEGRFMVAIFSVEKILLERLVEENACLTYSAEVLNKLTMDDDLGRFLKAAVMDEGEKTTTAITEERLYFTESEGQLVVTHDTGNGEVFSKAIDTARIEKGMEAVRAPLTGLNFLN